MSANITLNTVMNPFVICTNIGVNALTRLYYSALKNPNADQKRLYAAHFHYIVKVTAFNAATAYLAWRVLKALSGNSSIGPSIAIASITLFVRSVLEKSLSIQSGTKSIAKGVLSPFTNTNDLERLSFVDQAYTTACLAASRLDSLVNKPQWKEDFLAIQGYSVIKNWPQITYHFIFSRFH